MTDNVAYFLESKETKRMQQIAKTKETETKKNRLKNKHEKLWQDTIIAQKEQGKRDGTYKTGQNMDHVDDDADMPDVPQNVRRKKPIPVCPHCHKEGHKTTKSKKCLFYNGNNNNNEAAAQTDAQFLAVAAEPIHGYDAKMLDQMPLQDDPPSDVSFDEFYDADEFQDDDDSDVGIVTGNLELLLSYY
jgi:hypothetical protein